MQAITRSILVCVYSFLPLINLGSVIELGWWGILKFSRYESIKIVLVLKDLKEYESY